MSSTEQFNVLKEQIAHAFADSKYIGDENIVRPCDENNIDDLEVINIKKAFKGKRWKEVTLELLDKQNLGFTGYFTSAAFSYYLPAFLIAALDSSGEGVWTIGLTLSRYLSPNRYSDTHLNPDIEQLQLNKEQRTVVKQFLELLTTEFPDLFEHEQLESQKQIEVLMDFWRHYSMGLLTPSSINS